MRKSTVYVTKDDKENLTKLITDIGEILNKYPYSNDYSDHFITTMCRVKNSQRELAENISLLSIKN